MGKAKVTSKVPYKAAHGSGPVSAAKAKALKQPDNPFDRFANARKKHEVLNRKVKGEDRNVGRARAKVSKYCNQCQYLK